MGTNDGKIVMEGDSRICFNALNKVMLREHGHTNPWELRTMLEDILDLANEMIQVSFGLGEM